MKRERGAYSTVQYTCRNMARCKTNEEAYYCRSRNSAAKQLVGIKHSTGSVQTSPAMDRVMKHKKKKERKMFKVRGWPAVTAVLSQRGWVSYYGCSESGNHRIKWAVINRRHGRGQRRILATVSQLAARCSSVQEVQRANTDRDQKKNLQTIKIALCLYQTVAFFTYSTAFSYHGKS